MKHEHNAFENQIFHHFRERAKAINKAIELLVEHNYTVIDMESQILTKETIKHEGEEYPLVKLEISRTSHPYYTGKSKLVDTAGRIDKFKNKYSKFKK